MGRLGHVALDAARGLGHVGRRRARKQCPNLLRRFFAWAVECGSTTTNPCEGVRIKREDGDEDEGSQDTWYLDLADGSRLLDVAFAMGTGLRQGEQWCLHLEDVRVAGDSPHVVVRYGSYDRVRGRYRSPKGRAGEKHSRVVPLFGLALEATKAWLQALPAYPPENPHGLMFPTPTEARREGRLRRWPFITKAFGVVKRIGRKPWWHLLRHTCASSLVSGWWARAWRLEEVRDMLGHSVITTTERYAHLAPDALQAVATAANDAWESRHAHPGWIAKHSCFSDARPVRFERTTPGFEGRCSIQLSYGRRFNRGS